MGVVIDYPHQKSDGQKEWDVFKASADYREYESVLNETELLALQCGFYQGLRTAREAELLALRLAKGGVP